MDFQMLKENIALRTINYLISPKEKYRFNSKTIHEFQEEIIRQLQDWTRLKFEPMLKYIYNKLSNILIEDPSGKKIDIPLDPRAPRKPKFLKGPLDKYLN